MSNPDLTASPLDPDPQQPTPWRRIDDPDGQPDQPDTADPAPNE